MAKNKTCKKCYWFNTCAKRLDEHRKIACENYWNTNDMIIETFNKVLEQKCNDCAHFDVCKKEKRICDKYISVQDFIKKTYLDKKESENNEN